MRHFYRLTAQCAIEALCMQLWRQPRLWNQYTLRTTHPQTPHKEVSDIWLRFQDLALYERSGDAQHIIDEHESINYPAWYALPGAWPLVFDLMRAVQGERLGRVLLTRLPPGGHITPHIDGGAHAAYYERYHIVLQSQEPCMFRTGDEVVHMAPGECWWFDNSVEHEVLNTSAIDRIHLIIDIRTMQRPTL